MPTSTGETQTGRTLTRLAVSLLLAKQVAVGAWAGLAPRSFFDGFPAGRG